MQNDVPVLILKREVRVGQSALRVCIHRLAADTRIGKGQSFSLVRSVRLDEAAILFQNPVFKLIERGTLLEKIIVGLAQSNANAGKQLVVRHPILSRMGILRARRMRVDQNRFNWRMPVRPVSSGAAMASGM